MDRLRFPELALDHEFHGLALVVDQREQADRAGRNAEMLREPLRRAEAEAANAEHRLEPRDVDREVVPHGYQEMALPLLVAQEQVLRLGARQLWHEPQRLLDCHHRRMLVARGGDAVLAQERFHVHSNTLRATRFGADSRLGRPRALIRAPGSGPRAGASTPRSG